MKKDLQLFKLVSGALFVSSFSVLFSIFSDFEGNAFNKISGYMGAILFWLFLIVGYMFFYIISKNRKTYERQNRVSGTRPVKTKSRNGMFCFFSNKYAVIADIVMVVSLIATLVFMFIPTLNQNVAVVFVAILIFSLHMHAILNGVNFRYIKSLIDKGE